MNRTLRTLTFVLAAALLAACTGEQYILSSVNGKKPTPTEQARLEAITKSPTSLTDFLSDTTHKSFTNQHGTQIEYLSSDGRTYLVYPGNTVTVRGRWTADKRPDGTTVLCYLYARASYNPVTKQYGGQWECTAASLALYITDEIVPGDPLNLEKTFFLPQVMPKRVNVSIDEARQAIGSTARIGANKVTWDWRN